MKKHLWVYPASLIAIFLVGMAVWGFSFEVPLWDAWNVKAQQTDSRFSELGHFDGSSYPATISAGTGIGAGTTVACATSHNCNDDSGTITITTSSTASSTSAVIAKIAFNESFQTNQENCTWSGWSVASGVATPGLSALYVVPDGTSPFGQANVTVGGTALAINTTYTVVYNCGHR